MKQSESSDAVKLRELSERKFNMMLKSDTAALDQLLDANFTLTHLTGYKSPRAEWLSDLDSGRFVYHSIQPQSFDVSVSDQHSLAVSRAKFDATIYGGRGRYNLQLTESYRRFGDEWRLTKMVAHLF